MVHHSIQQNVVGDKYKYYSLIIIQKEVNNIMIRNINKRIPLTRLTQILLQNISKSQEYIEKLKNKQYFDILGIKSQDKYNFKGKDLHRAYLNEIKKYHSDGVHTEQAKKEYDQITKCITQAYQEIKKNKQNYKQRTQSEIFTEEESVAQQLFGKKYVDIKHTLYAAGNEQMRIKFITQLQRRRSAKNANQQSSQDNTSSSRRSGSSYSNSSGYSQSSSGDGASKVLGVVGLMCLACIPFFLHSKKTEINGINIQEYMPKQHKVREYSQKQYDIIHLNTIKIAAQPLQRFYNKLLKFRPHMLNYPNKKDPSILEQLATYSIAPDIKLYQVPSKYFINKNEYSKLLQEENIQEIPKYELKQTKPNTLMTLSLQAERALHNIYVNVDDVLAQIKEKGKFTPPKVLFKFHGYIMFEIRDKPFSNLINYRNTKYISLFELYFDYYSPIFFKRDYYKQYLTGFIKEDAHLHTRYFGNVYLNHREIPLCYLKKGQKVAIMKDYKSCLNSNGQLKQSEARYAQDWQNYYIRFQKNWKKYCTSQVEQ